MYEKTTKLLELDLRKKIYFLVKKHSGCHFRELERKSKIPAGTLRYHLDFLVKHSLLRREKQGNNLRYFFIPLQSENSLLLGMLRQKSLRSIILFILQNKKATHRSLVEFTHLSPSTVSWHLKKLIKEKIILQENNFYSLAVFEEEIIKLLISYRESFLDSLVNKTIEMWDVG